MTPPPEARRATPAELAQLRLDHPGAAAHCTTRPRRLHAMLDATRKTARRPLAALGALFAAMAVLVAVGVATPDTATAAPPPAADGFRLVAPDGSQPLGPITDPASSAPLTAASAVGATPYITTEGRCGVSVSTITPDAYRSSYLENGQSVKPGYRVGRIAAHKGCKVVVRSLGKTLTAWGQGPYVWVNLGGRTEGAVRISTSRP